FFFSDSVIDSRSICSLLPNSSSITTRALARAFWDLRKLTSRFAKSAFFCAICCSNCLRVFAISGAARESVNLIGVLHFGQTICGSLIHVLSSGVLANKPAFAPHSLGGRKSNDALINGRPF